MNINKKNIRLASIFVFILGLGVWVIIASNNSSINLEKSAEASSLGGFTKNLGDNCDKSGDRICARSRSFSTIDVYGGAITVPYLCYWNNGKCEEKGKKLAEERNSNVCKKKLAQAAKDKKLDSLCVQFAVVGSKPNNFECDFVKMCPDPSKDTKVTCDLSGFSPYLCSYKVYPNDACKVACAKVGYGFNLPGGPADSGTKTPTTGAGGGGF
ncbi:MAG: hypothetical protein EXS49_01305 [Candidatus Pacebacteria bacterium]|nr:hypothetical protein [Candidatus Paceibacterota bacterium]